MKIAISDKDKRSMILLGVFLGGAVYYVLLFDPLYQKWGKSEKELKKAKKELRVRHMKTREYNSWERDYQELGKVITDARARIRMPDGRTPHADILKAIMQAASKSGSKISNLRPITRLLEDGTTQVVDSFAMDGFTTMTQFTKLLNGLWGVSIDEVNLSMGAKGDRPVRFYLKTALIPQQAIQELALDDIETDDVQSFALSNDPFVTRPPKRSESAGAQMPLPSKPKPEPEEEKVPEPPKPTISGINLIGVGEIGTAKVAVVIETASKKDLFWVVGDVYKTFEVVDIDENGVELRRQDSDEIMRVELPPRKDELKPFKTESGVKVKTSLTPSEPEKPRKKARLGIILEKITPAVVEKMELQINSGLLVTKVSNPNADLNEGDIILAIDKLKVTTLDQVIKILKHFESGDELELSIIRYGEERKVKVVTM